MHGDGWTQAVKTGSDAVPAPLAEYSIRKWRFEEVTNSLGTEFRRPVVARGAAYGDYDRDGDLDILITTNHEPAHLLRSNGGNGNRWLSLRLVGTRSNQSALGAVVRVESASGAQWQMVHSGSTSRSRGAGY